MLSNSEYNPFSNFTTCKLSQPDGSESRSNMGRQCSLFNELTPFISSIKTCIKYWCMGTRFQHTNLYWWAITGQRSETNNIAEVDGNRLKRFCFHIFTPFQLVSHSSTNASSDNSYWCCYRYYCWSRSTKSKDNDKSRFDQTGGDF